MKTETFASVWDALADSDHEAAGLKAHAALFHVIGGTVANWKVSQQEAARRLGLTRPRLNNLLRGKLARFSLNALVDIAKSARLDVDIPVRRRG